MPDFIAMTGKGHVVDRGHIVEVDRMELPATHCLPKLDKDCM
jgi:hypothetical protein